MLKEKYKELRKFKEENLKSLINIASVMADKYPDTPDDFIAGDLGQYQQALIAFGEKLEKEFALYDSPYIKTLEGCCEDLFNYSEGKGKEYLSELKEKLILLDKELDDDNLNKSYYTSIVLIAKDEERYIREWLEYHRMVGIDHFYIYDNESQPSFKRILEKYIDSGLVTYIDYPGKLMQMNAYNHALKHFKFETEYMAFIDADEFLVPVKFKTIPEEIDFIISHYSKRKFKVDWEPGGIAVNWRWYGSSYHREKQEGLLIENYIYRAEDDYDQNAHVKTICNPRLAIAFEGHPHSCTYQKGYFNISEMGSYVPGAFFYDSSCSHLRINHYHMKSEEEFIEKWHRGWPDRVRTFDDDEQLRRDFRAEEEECNKIKDDIMQKYVDELKKRIV